MPNTTDSTDLSKYSVAINKDNASLQNQAAG